MNNRKALIGGALVVGVGILALSGKADKPASIGGSEKNYTTINEATQLPSNLWGDSPLMATPSLTGDNVSPTTSPKKTYYSTSGGGSVNPYETTSLTSADRFAVNPDGGLLDRAEQQSISPSIYNSRKKENAYATVASQGSSGYTDVANKQSVDTSRSNSALPSYSSFDTKTKKKEVKSPYEK